MRHEQWTSASGWAGGGWGQVTVARHIGRATTAIDPSQEPRTIKSIHSVIACVMSFRLAKVLQLPEPAEVGVRFCKPDRRRHRSAKLDTEDSDTGDSDMSTSSRPTVN